jgi:hypothetical protein
MSEASELIDYWNCADCRLEELTAAEASIHEDMSGHSIVPVYL